MIYFFVTLAALLTVFALMAIGLILRNKPIKGTCASLSNIGMKENCEICGGDDDKCETNKTQGKSAVPAIFTDAASRRE